VFNIPDPDCYLSASDLKDVAEEVIAPLLLPGVGVEGSSLDPGDIWLVGILACVTETSIWETCNEHNGTHPAMTLFWRCFTHLMAGGSKSVLTSSLAVLL